MPDIQRKKKYTNYADDNLVSIEVDEFDTLLRNQKDIEMDELIMRGSSIYSDEQILFFKADTFENDMEELRTQKDNYDIFKESFESKIQNESVLRENVDVVDISFEYNNELQNEQLELGEEITIYEIEPENLDDKLLLLSAKGNAFFNALGDDVKLCITEDGEKGISVGGIFFDEETVDYYLDKYPNNDETIEFHPDPKADVKNEIEQPTFSPPPMQFA